MNRRDFIQATLGALAAAPFVPWVPVETGVRITLILPNGDQYWTIVYPRNDGDAFGDLNQTYMQGLVESDEKLMAKYTRSWEE